LSLLVRKFHFFFKEEGEKVGSPAKEEWRGGGRERTKAPPSSSSLSVES